MDGEEKTVIQEAADEAEKDVKSAKEDVKQAEAVQDIADDAAAVEKKEEPIEKVE